MALRNNKYNVHEPRTYRSAQEHIGIKYTDQSHTGQFKKHCMNMSDKFFSLTDEMKDNKSDVKSRENIRWNVFVRRAFV